VWDMCGVRYANNLLKNPATKRLSGKKKEALKWPGVFNEKPLVPKTSNATHKRWKISSKRRSTEILAEILASGSGLFIRKSWQTSIKNCIRRNVA